MQKTRVQSWVGKSLWRIEWLPTPVFLAGEFPWTEQVLYNLMQYDNTMTAVDNSSTDEYAIALFQ